MSGAIFTTSSRTLGYGGEEELPEQGFQGWPEVVLGEVQGEDRDHQDGCNNISLSLNLNGL